MAKRKSCYMRCRISEEEEEGGIGRMGRGGAEGRGNKVRGGRVGEDVSERKVYYKTATT